MSLIKFSNLQNNIEVSLSLDDCGHIKIKFSNKEDIPLDEILLSGFKEINEHNYIEQSDFSNMRYIYRVLEDGTTYILSDKENDIYLEPEVLDYNEQCSEETDEQKAEIKRNQQIFEIQEQINNLKRELTSTDYQIIKSYEYSLVGIEIEYDINKLHQERQELRNQINDLEMQLSNFIVTE